MAKMYYDADADLDLIRARRIAILGYGSQGRAHALNLRDSGCLVRVGLYAGSRSREQAQRDGLTVGTVSEVCAWADLVSVLLADEVHRAVFDESIRPHLVSGDMLLVAHGFSIHYGEVKPPADVDVALVAPVGPGSMVRALFLEGSGVSAVMAVGRDATGRAGPLALSYAAALGCTRIGVIRSTFAEETETDLFGEQVVVVGGLTELIRAAFETLVEAEYAPEIAYFECLHQVKLLADLISEGGIAGMQTMISNTAEFGGRVSGPRIIDEHTRHAMREVLHDIQNGTFARRWIEEYEAGMPTLAGMRAEDHAQQIETVGEELRAMMRRQELDRAEGSDES